MISYVPAWLYIYMERNFNRRFGLVGFHLGVCGLLARGLGVTTWVGLNLNSTSFACACLVSVICFWMTKGCSTLSENEVTNFCQIHIQTHAPSCLCVFSYEMLTLSGAHISILQKQKKINKNIEPIRMHDNQGKVCSQKAWPWIRKWEIFSLAISFRSSKFNNVHKIQCD